MSFEQIDRTHVADVGGKGAHLGELSRIDGIRVPNGFCVTTHAYRQIIAAAPSIDDQLRPAVTRRARRPQGDRHAERADPPDCRGRRDTRRSGGGDQRIAHPARPAGRLRGAIQRDSGGPADGILRRPAGLVPEHRGPGGDPPARPAVLGLVVHRAGSDVPAAQRLRPPEGADGRGRAADGGPRGSRDPVHGRPRDLEPKDRHGGGRLGAGRGTGIRPRERGRLHGARRRGRHAHPSSASGWPSRRRRAAGCGKRQSSRSGKCGRRSRMRRSCAWYSWADGSRRTSAIPKTSSGAWSATTSTSSRAGRSPPCSPSHRPTTGRTTSTSPSVTSR